MGYRICSVGDCGQPHKARGLCGKHYARHRTGRPVTGPSKRDDWVDRFLRSIDDSGSCWLWTGRLTDKGYGVLAVDGNIWGAHRLSYALHHGDLPDSAFICHHCDNPPCVNPEHLYAGDQATNMTDMIIRGRGVYLAGEECGKSRLTTQEVLAIRADWATGRYVQADLGRTYGIAQGHVSSIVRRKVWKYV